jgi:hypothetical protein
MNTEPVLARFISAWARKLIAVAICVAFTPLRAEPPAPKLQPTPSCGDVIVTADKKGAPAEPLSIQAVLIAEHRLPVRDLFGLFQPYSEVPSNEDQEAAQRQRLLSGGGDVAVCVIAKSYLEKLDSVRSAAEKGQNSAATKTSLKSPPNLYINGFSLGKDATLVGTERLGEMLMLRYRVKPAKDSKPLWATVYKENGMTDDYPMRVAIGWKDSYEIVSKESLENLFIRVSTPTAELLAFLLVMALGSFFVWSLRNTDTFRDGNLNSWWVDACSLRKEILLDLNLNKFRNRKIIEKLDHACAVKALQKNNRWGDKYKGTEKEKYLSAANRVLKGQTPTTPAEIEQTILGLAIINKKWRPIRSSYSLARVQVGTWMMFATSAAVFLWVIYGNFPELEKTALSLVAISTVTAAASFIVDRTQPDGSGVPSKGFIYDISTGCDGEQKIHRYQAIVVNILLLSVGVMYVVQNLGYPEFDPSWLQFLGLSGIAQALGKRYLENETPTELETAIAAAKLAEPRAGRTTIAESMPAVGGGKTV